MADCKCHKLPTGEVAWSPTVQKAHECIKLWGLILKKKEGKKSVPVSFNVACINFQSYCDCTTSPLNRSLLPNKWLSMHTGNLKRIALHFTRPSLRNLQQHVQPSAITPKPPNSYNSLLMSTNNH